MTRLALTAAVGLAGLLAAGAATSPHPQMITAGCDAPGNGVGTHAASGTLYFTDFGGRPNVKRVEYDYENGRFSLGKPSQIGEGTPGADGVIFAPDGDLLVGGQGDAVYKVDPMTGKYSAVKAGGIVADHLSPDRSPTRIWAAGIPGPLAEIPLKPFGDGKAHPLKGDDLGVDSIAFDGCGNAYYTSSGAGGFGSFGRINLTTFGTTRLLKNLPAAHGLVYDPFTGDLMLFGANHVSQFDPKTQKLISDRIVPDVPGRSRRLDQGSTDGSGHAFVADNSGTLVFIDYAGTGLIGDTRDFLASPFLDNSLDDVAPLAGRGSVQAPPPQMGKSVNIAPVSGTVLARLPGTAFFVDVTSLKSLPVGSEIDTTKGRVRLTSATSAGQTQSADFFEGRFVVSQKRTAVPITVLTLTGPLHPCTDCRVPSTRKPKPMERHLWGSGKGDFRTKGKFASATVRGTVWETQDVPGATVVRVRSGTADVTDSVRHRHTMVRGGHSYVAKANPKGG